MADPHPVIVRDWRGPIVDYRNPDYWRQRKPEPPSWPEHDPIPEVLATDPRPDDAPADPRPVLDLVKRATAAGWEARVGYSRGPARAVQVNTYKMVETFGVWSARHPDTGWRLYAMYERTIGAATGWKWARTGIWRPGQGARFVEASVTDLKDFITVRGSVLPSWFKAIHVREEQKKAKQRVACPKCSQRTLERRNGETRITCTSCAATLSPDEYKALGRKHTTKPKEGLS